MSDDEADAKKVVQMLEIASAFANFGEGADREGPEEGA